MSTTQKQAGKAGIVAVMMIFLFSQCITALLPIQELLTTVFPTVSPATMTYASTIATLMALVGLLATSAAVGRVFSYKTAAILGFIFYAIGGALPFFFPTFTMILVSRALLGIGTGAFQLLGAPLLAAMIADDNKRSALAGVGTFVTYAGSCVMALASGLVAASSWKYSFLLHLVALLGLAFVIFGMDEPDFSSDNSSESDAPAVKESALTSAKKVPLIMWIMILGSGMLAAFCLQVDISSSYVLADMGASQQFIGVAVSLAYVGYASGGLLYIPLNRVLKGFTMPGAVLMCIIGMSICYFATTPVLFIIGGMICAAGYSVNLSCMMFNITVVSDKSAVTLVNTALMFGMSFFGFASSPVYSIGVGVTGDPIKGQFVPALICLIVIFIVLCFARMDKIKTKHA